MMKWGRRLLVAAVAVATPAVGAIAQDEPIKIGAVYIMSGPFSANGEFARNGIDLAVEEINESGGILGRDVEFKVKDSAAKANVAIQSIRSLVLEDKVDVLMGLDSSGVARSVLPLMRHLKKPFMVTHAGTPDVTGQSCNDWVFRNSLNVMQNMRAAADLAKELGGTRWTTIGPDYAYGYQTWEFFQSYLTEINPDVAFLEPNFPQFRAKNFKPFINKVMEQNPDGVMLSLWGGDLINFVPQAAALGFFDQDFEVLVTLGAAIDVLDTLGDKMPEGVWLSTRYWFDGLHHTRNTEFVNAYEAKFGDVPSYNSQNAYTAVYAYKQAMEAAGTTEAKAVTAALSGMEISAPVGTFTFREADHQAVLDAFWGKTAAMDANGLRTLDPLNIIPGESIIPSAEETGCTR